jgi:GT2 family glycosyltransferase
MGILDTIIKSSIILQIKYNVIISVVVLTYNSEEYINECLRSISAQPVKTYVYIIDNNSTDNTVEIVKRKYPQVKIVENKMNQGYAAGMNLGISIALKKRTNAILLLNPDTVLLKSCLPNLISAAKKKSNHGVFHPLMYTNKRKGILWGKGGNMNLHSFHVELDSCLKPSINNSSNQIIKYDFVPGTCMYIPIEIFSLLRKYFYEPYFMYYEDVEFCYRLKKIGYPSFFVSNAHLIHYKNDNLKKSYPHIQYYLSRNRLLFLERYAPITDRIKELLSLPMVVIKHYKKGEKYAIYGIKDYLLRKFGPLI